MNEPIKVLVVDDNMRYRQAFSRNLVLQGMQVIQAEHSDQAIDLLRNQSPDVMVTDLNMRTPTEGLDLIRATRTIFPCLPIIMISAVGTFDEGAAASRLGAAHVISKARIEDEMSVLYDCIRESHQAYKQSLAILEEIAQLRQAAAFADESSSVDTSQAIARLREIMENPRIEPYVKSEAFDALNSIGETQMRQRIHREVEHTISASSEARDQRLDAVMNTLSEAIPCFSQLDPDTRDALRTAEFLFQNGGSLGTGIDLSRTTCFSYCFSVENQAKLILRKRLTKFLGEKENLALIKSLQEKNSTHVNLFFQQNILQTMRDRDMDFTIDNVRQTFLRILEHQIKYRPDGLKALGILLLIFGRVYEFKQFDKTIRIENPLGMKGIDDTEMVLFAQLLINLQHFRNPYIHPEIEGREAIGRIRDCAVQCLNIMMRLK